MKFILVGQHNPEWALRAKARSERAFSKVQQLGLRVESSYYTQGQHDYVTIIEAPDAETVSRFSIWYAAQGFGRVETMRAYTAAEMNDITNGLSLETYSAITGEAHDSHASVERAINLPVYESYTQGELDHQYNPRLAVNDFSALAEDWRLRSAEVRKRLNCSIDIAYGVGSSERLDVFSASSSDSPVVIFFHGGYWRSGDKSDFSFVAQGLVEAGVTVVVPNYALCPNVTMGELVEQCYKAVRWVCDRAGELGADASRVYLAGHSAGAHITSMTMTDGAHSGVPEGAVRGGLAISGLYNLEPLRRSFLNLEVRLDPEQVQRYSPAGHVRRTGAGLVLAVGAEESLEFHRQTREYHHVWQSVGNKARCLSVDGADHYTVLDSLADRQGILCQALLQQLAFTADAGVPDR